MKKMYPILLASLAFFACSRDDGTTPSFDSNEQVIYFNTVAEMEVGISRRPLYSQEALQNVSDMHVYAFKKDGSTYKYLKDIGVGWTIGTTSKKHTIPPAENLPAGSYTLVAVGTEQNAQHSITLTPNVTLLTEMTITPAVNTNIDSEIFSGMTTVDVSASVPGIRATITLKRKVAGVLGYFKNVPTTIDGKEVKYLRLSISNMNTRLYLGQTLANTPTGTKSNLFDLDLSLQGKTGNIFNGPTTPTTDLVQLPNSQLLGMFILPVENISMRLFLANAAGQELIGWPVTLNGLETFTILENNLYSFGRKVVNNSTTGLPGKDDDDKAIDLMEIQSLSLTLNPTWGGFHDLVVSPL